MTYLASLLRLIGLPLLELGLDLLNGGRDIGSGHGGLDTDEAAILHDGGREAEGLASGGRGSASGLLGLLALLDGGEVVVITLLLADKLHALEARVVDLAESLGSETLVGKERSLLGDLMAGVEVLEERVGAADLLEVGGVGSLSKHLLGALHAALLGDALTLGLLSLAGLLALLTLPLGELLLGTVVLILELLDGLVLLALELLELGALVTEAGEVLVGLVLLGLDGVKLSLKLVVLLAESLSLRILQAVLDLLDLGLQRVDLLLGIVETSKALALLAEVGDLGKGLLLVNELHHAAVDLLLQTLNLAVEVLGGLEVDLAASGLLLGNAAAELLIETLDLVELGGAGILAAGLLLTDLVELGDELLTLLLGRAGLVLVLARSGELNLGLDLVLYQ